MVGIILATHGEFAKGILQSSQMIFGQQENLTALCLMPEMGPEDLKQQMEDAIAVFDNQDEVLFLVDLWGGTPFNQASGLCDGHDSWAIVSGLNLPMVLEALGGRFMMETAHEIAAHVLAPAQEGVRVLPEDLAPEVEAATAEEIAAAPQGAIPEGTVVGDGKLKVVLARIDSRLLHGQVATGWTKATGPDRIIVVSDKVAQDDLRKKLIQQAAPPGVKAHVVPIQKMAEVFKDTRFGGTKALLLFESPEEVLELVEAGAEIPEVNVGSLAHSTGKVAVNRVISMDQSNIQAFKALRDKGIKFDVRKVPADSSENLEALVKKAEELLKAKS